MLGPNADPGHVLLDRLVELGCGDAECALHRAACITRSPGLPDARDVAPLACLSDGTLLGVRLLPDNLHWAKLSHDLDVPAMLSRMSGYTWEGTSSTARFFGKVREQNAGEVPVLTDDARSLSLAVAAHEEGFEVAPDAPLWLFLPAIWPVESRAWIRDNRIRQLRTLIDGRWLDLPWGAADYFEVEASEQGFIQSVGLPPRPPGRVWLLRPPPGVRDLNEVLDVLTDSARSAGVAADLTGEFLDHTAGTLRALFEPA